MMFSGEIGSGPERASGRPRRRRPGQCDATARGDADGRCQRRHRGHSARSSADSWRRRRRKVW